MADRPQDERLTVTIGETMALVTPAPPAPLATAQTFEIHPAGAESNVALFLAALKHRVAWASRLGADPLGDRVRDFIAAGGVDTSLVDRPSTHPTGTFFKDPAPADDGAASTTVHYYRAGSAASTMDREFAESLPWKDIGLVHVSGVNPALSPQCAEMTSAVIELAHRHGSTVSLDVNHRPALWSAADAAPVLADYARRCDIVLVGRDEAERLWDTSTADAIAQLLPEPDQLVIKDAEIGATAYVRADGASPVFVPAPPVDVVEPVGAGDAFAAGYLSGWLDGRPVPERLAEGHRMAGVALRSVADVPPHIFTDPDFARR